MEFFVPDGCRNHVKQACYIRVLRLKIRFSETPKYGDSQQKKIHAIILRRTDSSGLFRRPFFAKFFFFFFVFEEKLTTIQNP